MARRGWILMAQPDRAEAVGPEGEDQDSNVGMSGAVATRRGNYRLVRSLCTEKQKCFAMGPSTEECGERGKSSSVQGIRGQGSDLQHLLTPTEFSQRGSL